MNDEELKDCAVLAIAEPYARKKDGMIVTAPMGHSSWSRILPTQTNEAGWPVRSMLWIRKDIDSEQVPIPSSDLTAAVLHLPDRDVLVMSVYVQGKDEEALILTTTELGGLITRFRNGTGKRTDVVLAGDFNRHDLLWEAIVLLPRGTKTWQGPDKESTIDLMLVSTELADDMVKCAIHPAEYGSDHRAIHTAFDIDLPERDLTPRLLLRNAPWTAIRNRVEQELRPISWDGSLQDQTDRFMEVVLKLTMEEIERKVMTAKPWKAPGDDGLPAMVWRQLWPVVRGRVVHLFRLSVEHGVLPKQWRMAKIIPLKKPGKDDYTAARAWRPISLLSTLGKILEAVMAERISFAVETFGLLPTNHFGARKRRSAEQALVLLQEKIYKAWRMGKVLSLVNFDVKGAYNGVFKDRLLQRLAARGLPRELVRWVDAFCSERTASITVNGHCTAQQELPQAGLPQGSPLSPILFLFFNADLVQTKISTSGGSIAFVDDYSAWVTGSTAESNRDGIQSIIDRA
ncbi:reverse transcriptase (RNA-dependent DNA polymerase) [Hirsutella rhossiliensis]